MITFLERSYQKRIFNRIRKVKRQEVVTLIEKLRPCKVKTDLIRLGPKGDGGYLVPNDLQDIKACFSAGVSNITGFEEDCLRLGIKTYMADRSVDTPVLNGNPEDYSFIKKHVGCTNNSDYITMDSWVNSCSVKECEDLILQMDIEGSEFKALINISDSLMKRFRIIVIEFHSLNLFWNSLYFDTANDVFNKILQTHSCVHIHPNNCCGIDIKNGIEIPRVAEFTFYRNDRIEFGNKPLQFPHKLDYDNRANKHIVLPTIWYNDHWQ